MSRTNLTTWERFELQFECRHCHAKVGDWCVTDSGRWAGYPHAERYYLAKAEQQRRQHKGQQ